MYNYIINSGELLLSQPTKHQERRHTLNTPIERTETEVMAFVRANVIESLIGTLDALDAAQIGTATYAIPVEVDGEVRFAKVAITATKDTFDITKEVDTHLEAERARQVRAVARAEAKAAKAAAAALKAEAASAA